MNILILGGDGYLGWPTAMHFADLGYNVAILDNLAKRGWEAECGVSPLIPLPTLQERVDIWNSLRPGSKISLYICDIAENDQYLYKIIDEVDPDTIIHYAEQPSAPYSMMSRRTCTYTQRNNIQGTLNLILSILHHKKDIHLVKLGTMGEYGTPNIDIEEGWLEVTHKGRTDRVLYPKKPGSWYHLSKVHDSHNLEFACRVYGLRVTDLNQGIVYGISTDQIWLDKRLATSFHYDATFGTAINRFITQALIGEPITVYGEGGQTRGWLNIRDTLACVQLAVENPPSQGEFRVHNQFTEVFSVRELARLIKECLGGEVVHIPNPRVEEENHYFNATNSSFMKLGLTPHDLTVETVLDMKRAIDPYKDSINKEVLTPKVRWKT